MPSVDDLTSGRTLVNQPRSVAIEDLLGRDTEVARSVLSESIDGSVICVTGAEGFNWFEICRQILDHYPQKIILIENSEPFITYSKS